ncbi:MAG: thioesterase [Chloroflexi bacterium]|nr:thioesterase [Chloroflexota bacterium]MBU1749917.1 thioesterase [Chloroflexota bacterium]
MEGTRGLRPGLTGEAELVVTEENTAMHLGSGQVLVLGTPALLRLMEIATVSAVDVHLPPDQVSVGIRVDITHLAPTPLGLTVKAWAEIVDLGERRVVLQVEAYDDVEKVAEGTIERVVVDRDRFEAHVGHKLTEAASSNLESKEDHL